ncbi:MULTISPECIES: nuclear transport factor 2 family protein [Pseudomonas]|uniref:Nuclear transport factor 2 family protein n=1 Tax=Pseudomonas sessilinigenes TaxID=658629 RepID=A0ABX8MIU2_9PSED|nr:MULTISPECIES: nuclear transport factor 2 family protein [Pseudomonas]AZC26805.1 Electron transfer flavoprotein, beta subunit [Pseudomonas sessilinigenes]QIH07888.1 nuclear transport factor 2 family protein [Pseudomonas sp. BIOMIG1BAC]QXH39217.1 nuclear transport factor 2 family protein [Pseudomonas sessilinigenes]
MSAINQSGHSEHPVAKVLLAPAIVAYIAATNSGDSSRAAAIFAPKAQVFDEREYRVGPQDIARWMDDSHRHRRCRLEVVAVQQRPDKVLLDGRICGDFPGSPQSLRQVFRLDEQGLIARLDISR